MFREEKGIGMGLFFFKREMRAKLFYNDKRTEMSEQ